MPDLEVARAILKPEPGGPAPRLVAILRWAAFLACVLLFVQALRNADLAAAWRRIAAVGPVAVFVLLPFPAALAMDAWAWKGFLEALERRVTWLTLFKVRLATEAVTNSAPVGAVWAEALAPVLVARRAGIPTEDVFATSTAKRWTVVRAHAVYVTLAASFGSAAILRASQKLFGNDSLVLIVLASALVLLLFSLGFEWLAARAGLAGRVSGMLGRARFMRIQLWIETRRHHFARADAQLSRLSEKKSAGLTAGWRLLGLWLIEGFETYLILRLLGAQIGLVEVMSFDAALSVVRSTAVFAPAGIGVQDVGYLAVLEAYGIPDAAAIGPAFVVVKRLKEAVWIAIGFIVLARTGPRGVLKEAEREKALQSEPPPPHPPSAST